MTEEKQKGLTTKDTLYERVILKFRNFRLSTSFIKTKKFSPLLKDKENLVSNLMKKLAKSKSYP